jgi:hypothetical protein
MHDHAPKSVDPNSCACEKTSLLKTINITEPTLPFTHRNARNLKPDFVTKTESHMTMWNCINWQIKMLLFKGTGTFQKGLKQIIVSELYNCKHEYFNIWRTKQHNMFIFRFIIMKIMQEKLHRGIFVPWRNNMASQRIITTEFKHVTFQLSGTKL